MKKILFLLAFSCSLFLHSHAQSTACADSVKSTYYWQLTGAGEVYTVRQDTFDLDSGFVHSCISTGSSAATLSAYTCTDSFWAKHILSYDLQGRVVEDLIQVGSPNGWIDSSRVLTAFDINNGKPLSITSELWDGAAWNQTALHSYTYDANGFLIDEFTQEFVSGNTINKIHTSWVYSGSNLISKTIQTGNGNLWVNTSSYNFTYDVSNARDSVTYQLWDTLNSVWQLVGTSPYYNNGLKLADFDIVRQIDIIGTLCTDSAHISIDTLENIIQRYELLPTHYENGYGFFYTLIKQDFIYFNSKYLISYNYAADYFDDGTGNGHSWYCTGSDATYGYDVEGYLTSTAESARCVMPRTFTTRYFYNTSHVLMSQTGHLDANVSQFDYEYDYFYSNSDSLIAYFSPFSQVKNNLCVGAVVQPELIASGGCGNYHYLWTPNTGLSSDTISNPFISITDTANYTIAISDDNGHNLSLPYQLLPLVVPGISIDTSTCVGCVPTITANSQTAYYYQWFYEGVQIPNEYYSSIHPTQTGYYYVVIGSYFTNCTVTTDSVFYLASTGVDELQTRILNLHPNPTTSISTLSIVNSDPGSLTIRVDGIKGDTQRLIYQGRTKSNFQQFELDASQFAKGVYIVSVMTESTVKQIRWVVE